MDLESGRKFFNYYKDECLIKAGGEATGVFDFAQIHTYADGGSFHAASPMSVDAASFGLDKPVVIGEFSTPDGTTVESLYQHAVACSYGGVWDWSMIGGDNNDGLDDAVAGMQSIASDIARVSIGVDPPADTCSCSDVPPSSDYTCAEQAGWGQCDQSWMAGFCCRSCSACSGCS